MNSTKPQGYQAPPMPLYTLDRSYSVKTILKLKQRVQIQLQQFLNQTIIDGTFLELVTSVEKVMPKKVGRLAVRDSLFDLLGQLLTSQRLNRTAWRLAGNLPRLTRGTAGEAVPAWSRQPKSEWVPSQIVGYRRDRTGSGMPGYTFTFRIMAGLPAGMTAEHFWSDRTCWALASTFGFQTRAASKKSREPDKHQFHDPRELVGMRVSLLVESAHSTMSGPGFFHIRIGKQDKTWNLLQMNYRDRLEERYACPKQMPTEQACHLCPWGYTSCRVAVHRANYVARACPRCNRPAAAFDPDSRSQVCVDCTAREALAR